MHPFLLSQEADAIISRNPDLKLVLFCIITIHVNLEVSTSPCYLSNGPRLFHMMLKDVKFRLCSSEVARGRKLWAIQSKPVSLLLASVPAENTHNAQSETRKDILLCPRGRRQCIVAGLDPLQAAAISKSV